MIPGFDEEERAAEAAELEEDAQAELAELAFSLGGLQLGLDEDDEAADLAEEEGNIVVPGAAGGGVGPEPVVPLSYVKSSGGVIERALSKRRTMCSSARRYSPKSPRPR